jgi:hypothetical protein
MGSQEATAGKLVASSFFVRGDAVARRSARCQGKIGEHLASGCMHGFYAVVGAERAHDGPVVVRAEFKQDATQGKLDGAGTNLVNSGG